MFFKPLPPRQKEARVCAYRRLIKSQFAASEIRIIIPNAYFCCQRANYRASFGGNAALAST